MAQGKSKTTLLTGATGLLGRYVLAELLKRDRRVIAMLRAPLADSRRRLMDALQATGIDFGDAVDCGRLQVVEGHLPDGLPADVDGPIDSILHSAASLRLYANGDPDPYRTNTDGAVELTRWADRHGVRRIHAVSTAYVCGWNQGKIDEVFHDPCPEFQTDYERSKWQAESRFAEWARQPGRTLTVLRPSYLVGDSGTGYTNQFGGIYQLARLVGILKDRHADESNGQATKIPLRIPGQGDDAHDLVPVDFAARVLAEIVLNERFHGRIYHLTNPNPVRSESIKSWLEEYFNVCGGSFASADALNDDCSVDEALIFNDVIQPRISHSPFFQQANTAEVIQAADLQFPVLDRRRFHLMLDYAVAQKWGRRRNGNGSRVS